MKILPSGISKQSKSLTDWKELTKKAQAFDGENTTPELSEVKIEVNGQAGGWDVILTLYDGEHFREERKNVKSLQEACRLILMYDGVVIL